VTRYRDISLLGKGGMASVVLAQDTVLGREVALKRMHPNAMDRRALLRLRREALIGASMSHPNLVSIYDVFETEDGGVTIVMEYVEGETLRAALKREGRLPQREALRVLGGVAAGLDAIHDRGIVHRDVKPANVLLGMDGRVKLADLGIASVPDHTRITTAGTVLGSFRYMAPEQLKDGPATRAIDIYALAAMGFEVLGGQQARREENPLAVAHAIASQPPPDLRAFWPEAPPQAAEVIMCGMCRDPAGRPASAGELVRELESALEPRPSAPVAFPVAAAGALASAAGTADRARALSNGAPTRTTAVRAPSPAAAPLAAARTPAARTPAARTPAARTPAARTAAPWHRETNRTAHPAPLGMAAPTAGATKMYTSRAVAGRVLAPLALVLAVGIVLFAVLSSGPKASTSRQNRSGRVGGATRASAGARAHRTSAASATSSGAAGTGGTTPAGSATTSASAPPASGTASSPATGSGSPASPQPGTPVGAVESFYGLAASHQYSRAWTLADPTFRRQLGGYDSFVAGQSADRAILFDTAQTLRRSAGTATVYIRTTSVRTTGTQHCSGTVQLVSGASSGWLLHLIGISCS